MSYPENLCRKDTVTDLRDRVERILAHEREHPVDPGETTIAIDQVADVDFESGAVVTMKSSG